MEYITNKRGEQVTFEEFITWPAYKQNYWSQRGHSNQKTSEIIRAKWQDPEYREKQLIDRRNRLWANRPLEEQERINQKRRETMRAKSPEEQEKISQKRRETMRRWWQDPEYREHIMKARANKTPEEQERINQKRREGAKKMWATRTPKKMAQRMKKYKQTMAKKTPEELKQIRQKQSEKMKLVLAKKKVDKVTKR